MMGTQPPEPRLTLHELTTYVQHCERLVRDIDFVLSDEQFRHNGWRLVYAVDFSEISNYVLPKTPEFAPFSDGWSGWANEDVTLTQFNILRRFFTKQRPLILPEPYVVELSNFYESLPNRIVSDVAQTLLHSIEAMNRTLSSDASKKVIEMAKGSEGRSLQPEEIKFVIEFFEKEAASLVLFARGGELAPIDRLNELLSDEPFVNLTDFVAFDAAQFDDELVNARYVMLRRARGRHRSAAVSFSDAVALEHIRIANKALEKEKTRILLLARSRHMPNILEKETERDAAIWNPNGPIVRHPRVFSNAFDVADTNNPRLPSLQRRKASLELLIASASNRASREKSAHVVSTAVKTASRDPKALITQIQDEWTVTNSLATALESDIAEEPRTDQAATAGKLLGFLRNHEELYRTAQERVTEIVAATTRKHEILAFQLQTDPTETPLGDIKYRIAFDDKAIRDVMNRLVDKPFVTTEEATEFFTVGLKSTSNYERLLAMAVSLGALGRWQLSEQAAGRAILEAGAEGVSAHEGHFVKAFTIRKQKTTPRRIGNALADLDAAMVERKEAGLAERDPRYLKEKATIELVWSRKTTDADGHQYVSEFTPTADDIVALLEEALALATDTKLKADILNNCCYLFATPPTVDEKRARNYLELLEKTLAEWTSDRRAWPSTIRDTVVFTSFQLAPFETTSLETFELWARELESIVDTELNIDELRWLRKHRSSIHDAIRRKRGDAAIEKQPV